MLQFIYTVSILITNTLPFRNSQLAYKQKTIYVHTLQLLHIIHYETLKQISEKQLFTIKFE